MKKQSDLQTDAMQCKFDLAGKLWLKQGSAPWQEASFVLQAQGEEGAFKKTLASVKVVWVPTEQVSLLAQFVPGKRKQDWLAALPYALEESLAEPVESLHFVVLNRTSQGLVSVAVVSKSRMQQWVEHVQLMGLGQVQLVADCFQVAVAQPKKQADSSPSDSDGAQSEQAWSLFKTDEARCLVRTGEYSGFAGSLEWYQQLVQLHTQRHGEIDVHKVDSVSQHCQTGALSQTAPRQPCQAFNLRTGAYQARSQQAGLLKRWLWPALLLGLAVLVYLAGIVLQTEQRNAQAQAYQAQTEALFKQRFPEVKRIVNIQAQAKSAFNKRANSSEQAVGPSQLIQQVDPLFTKHPTIQVRRLDWRAGSGQLAISVQAPNLSTLQALVGDASDSASGTQASQMAKDGKRAPMELKVKNVSQTLAEGVLYVGSR